MAKGHGHYTEILEEEFLPVVTKTNFVICHFFHKDFERCKIFDHHLSLIAKTHMEAKFVSMNAERCPFFIAKLQVQVLPTIICFMDGISVDRIVGFEELGSKDEFPTLLLARRLIKSGCLRAMNKKEKGEIKIKRRGDRDDSDSGNDEY
jgi:thioredoxin-like negative regulator of GroEL